MLNGYVYFYFPKQNHLYNALESIQIFVLWLPISIIFLLICIRMLLYDALIGKSSHYQLIHSSTSILTIDTSQKNRILILIFILILLPLTFFTTTLLPNQWTHFDEHTIYEWVTTTNNTSNDKTKKQLTILWQIGNHYLHLYFDTMVFYGALFLTAFIGFICRQFNTCNRFMLSLRSIIIFCKERKYGRFKCDAFYLTTANLIILLIWIPVMITIFVYWVYIHDYGPGNPPDTRYYNPIVFDETSERISRSFGVLSCVCLGLLLIPVTRSNVNRVMEYCFGIEFQEGIIYHKVLGTLFLLFSAIHYVIFIILFIINSGKSEYKDDFIPYWNIPWKSYHPPNFTISLMYGVLFLIIIPIFFIITLFEYFRRYHFELFYYLHLYGAQVLIISLLFHAQNGWYYMLPGLLLQFIERLYRIYNSTQVGKLINLEQISSVITRLEIAIPHNYSFASGKWSSMNDHPCVKLGQYCFINIPNISPLEWHPFSISNPLNHPSTVFYIKNMHRGWTKKLNKIAEKSWCITNLNIGIEGPYGITLDFENYDHIILIAGGVGITPMHNIFFTFYREVLSHGDSQLNVFNKIRKRMPSIELWWINRRADAFSYYIDSFRDFQNNPVEFMKIKLYATRERNRNSVVSDNVISSSHFNKHRQNSFAITWDSHRPYLPTALSFMKQYGNKGLLYVCGPKSMVDDSLQAAYQNKTHFKREYFLW